MNAIRNPAPFAVIGLIMAFLFAIVWIVAAENDPTWVLGESKLSEMGVSTYDLTANAFKYGCIVCGILCLVFGIGKAACEDGSSCASGIMCAAAGIALAFVGYFTTESNPDVHDIAAYLLFVFLALAVALSVHGDWSEGKRINGLVGIILFAMVIACFIGKDIAYTEAVAVICGLLWVVSESVKMIVCIKAAKDVKVEIETV